MHAAGQTLNGFPEILARSWVWGRRLLWTVLLVGGALVVLNAIHLYGLLALLNVWLARVVTLTLAGGLLVWSLYVFWHYLRTPRALTPPDLPLAALGWNETEQQTYRDFAVRYLRRQQKNPQLAKPERGRIAASIETVASAQGDAEELCRIVEHELDQVLAPLDERAKRLIRRAAVEVATATAISPSILLDSLITLTRNLNLIARLADLYYGRPGLFGTLKVSRDVIGSAVAAGALEVASDHLSAALAEMTGSWSARLIGPMGQGMVNGVVTLRFGAAARWRCRSLTRRKVPWKLWDLAQYRRAFSSLLGWISEDVGPTVFGPLQRVVNWTGDVADSTVQGGKSLLRRVKDSFTRKPQAAKSATETAEALGTGELDDDPLMRGGLLE